MKSKDINLYKMRHYSWSWLLRNLLLPVGDFLVGQKMIRRLRFLEQAQWWDSERLHAYRDRLLRALITVAYKEVPFYRRLMDVAKVRPEDIEHPQELIKLPLVTKDMLRGGYPRLTCRKTAYRTYENRTSGSSGENFQVRIDTETAGWYRASFILALEWAGWRIGEPHLQMGITPNRIFLKRLKDILLNCHYLSAFDLTDYHLDLSLELLQRRNIRHLWGYPGSLYLLARRALQKGWNRPLSSVVTWGDMLYPHYRKAIEEAFKSRVFDTYGCAEGMQIAAQCGCMDGYHLHTLDVVVEFLDDEGRPLPLGKPGNLIITRLHPGPMPLIRYKVGDIGVAKENSRCKCGRGYDILSSIQGRDTDVVITPSGNRLIVHFFTGVLEHFSELLSFQVVQERLESMVLRVVPGEGFSREVKDKIKEELKRKGAGDMKIEIESVDDIPLPPSGKRRFVISKLARRRR